MRTGNAIKAGVFCLAALVAAAGLSVTASHTNVRADLTLDRRHQITDRTRARMRALDVPVELVIAVARDRLDPRHADRVDDVLDAIDAASPLFTVTRIDVTGPRGPEQFEALIGRLEARDADGRAARETAAAQARQDAGALQWDLTSLDAAVTAAAEAAQPSDPAAARRLGEFAAYARAAGRQINDALGSDAAQAEPGALVRSLAELAGRLAPQLDAMGEELGEMAIPPRARTRVTEAERLVATLRARTRTLAESAPPETDLDRVAQALGTGEAALLIGPVREDDAPGLVALELDAFYPPPEKAALDTTGEADARVRAEQLVSRGLTVLTDRTRPIVVFTHGEPIRFVGQAGVMTGLLERMAKAGIDHAEWPIVLDASPPDLSAIDPTGDRPVVYAVISPNSAQGSGGQSAPGTERTIRVAEAIGGLIERGEPVLLGLNPSVFPTFGDEDPIAALLDPFGVEAMSDTPILSESNTAFGPAVAWDMRIVPSLSAGVKETANPVAVAAEGLPIALEWPVPFRMRGERPEGTTVDALLTLDIPGAWSETEWLAYRRTDPAQRPLLRNPPAYTPPPEEPDQAGGSDDRPQDERGPFTVAVAIEHGTRADGAPARLVAVGSNTWFLDRVWAGQQNVSGRRVLTNPGNPELFDAAVLWLAGRDELIATSPEARPVARIEPLSEGTLALLRWSLIGGLPLGILAIGGVWRIVRG